MMGLKTIVKFFKTESDETLCGVFGTSDLNEIFDKYDDETIRVKIEDYVRKLYDSVR